MLVLKAPIFYFLDSTFIIFKVANIFNTPSSSDFPHKNHPVKWIGLRNNDWPEVTQMAFIPKVGLEFPISWFLDWSLNHTPTFPTSLKGAKKCQPYLTDIIN